MGPWPRAGHRGVLGATRLAVSLGLEPLRRGGQLGPLRGALLPILHLLSALPGPGGTIVSRDANVMAFSDPCYDVLPPSDVFADSVDQSPYQ